MKKKTHKISLFAGIIALSLLAMEAINKFIFLLSTKRESLYRENTYSYNWRFGKISYNKIGSGSPILLIHDLSNLGSSYEFKDLEKCLSKTNTVYTIDLIGCGLSDKPKITYTNYLYVQLISDFIKNVVGSKTTVLTSNRSSSIGIMASYIDPAYIKQLVLINPTDLNELAKFPKRKHKLLQYFFSIPIIGTFIYNMCNTRCCINNKVYKQYLYKHQPIQRYREAFFTSAHTQGSASKYLFTSIKCHYTNINILRALQSIDKPIYILAGSDVPNIKATISDYVHYNPDISVSYIDNSKEMPHIEKTMECINQLSSIL
ncbi:MAG: hypothetical protein Q4F05_00095 [bacterium]|nr:hypothetical protein [bacterium]